ncbi:MAG: hypothetical protein PF486_09665 [Prolixibacteraceae bacterium]|nr:hypothetical protein [Prolixibacteraceae bacterium]
MKKKFIFSILLFIAATSYGQKNALTTYLSHSVIFDGDVFQLKYERNLTRSLSVQTGIRYHNSLGYDESGSNSYIVQQTYQSYKLDVSFLIAPVKTERFQLKTGLGGDVGLSEYLWAGEGYGSHWRSGYTQATDLGIHYILQTDYSFTNNMLISGQILYNYVFNDDNLPINAYRESPLCVGIGIGYRF